MDDQVRNVHGQGAPLDSAGEDLRLNRVRLAGTSLESLLATIRDKTGLAAYDLRTPRRD